MTLLTPRAVGRAWGMLLAGVCLGQFPAPAQAQDPASEAPVEAAAADTPTAPEGDAETRPRFDIDLEAPDELRDLLLRHMALQRFRTLPDLDAEELDRLLAQARTDIEGLLGTQGYFAPDIRIEPPVAGSAPLGTVRLRVQPGPATRVADVNVYFRGDIAHRTDAAAQREGITANWSLQTGERFTQSAWSSAKADALRSLTTRRYPLARVYNSLADIDPTQHAAHLSVEFDSGPPVQLGALRIEGAERYDTATVRHVLALAGLREGSVYDLAVLQTAQQRLSETGYYEAAYVTVEPSASGEPATVLVQLREARKQQLSVGIGASTDNGARFTLEHTHHRVPYLDWRSQLTLKLERKDSVFRSEWSSPLAENGWRWITSAQAARQLDGLETTTSQRLRWGRSQDGQSLDRSYYLQYDRARTEHETTRALGTDGYDASVSANMAWTQRRFDALPFPRAGYGLGFELGVGTTLGSERQPFTRGEARWLGYWPLSDEASSRAGRVVLRLEGGAVWAAEDARIPQTLLFLTGGDTTVRGYSLRAIGIPQSDGGVSPGRYKAVASVEWQRPVGAPGGNWEHVVFIDAGSITDSVKDWRIDRGIGTGIRYNSPVGPLQVDLAWGERMRAWRLHLNVGFSF